MNERIKELDRQARKLALKELEEQHISHSSESWAFYWNDKHAEKLTELIIEQCRYMMDCNKGGDQHPEWNRALWETSKKIKEHFGVE